MINNKRSLIEQIDKKLILTIVIILGIGLSSLRSASMSLDGAQRIMRQQYIATVIGLVVLTLLTMMDYEIFRSLSKPMYIVSVALLIITLLFGDEAKGAQSWLTIPKIGFRFQPSEFTKVALVIWFAEYLERHRSSINEPKILVKTAILVLLPAGLIFIQPDFGTTIVYIFFMFAMLFYAGLSKKVILILILIGLLMLPIIWVNLTNIQKNRILDFFNSEYESNYQAHQGIIATGSGQLKGKGLYKGNQNQFGFIPEKHNDFIYPTVVEETGFIGGALVILLYGTLLQLIFKNVLRANSQFGGLILVGIGAILFFHIFENIGMTIGVMPITGIPLPFFSAGGTFQLINLVMMGLVLSVSSHSE